ncbi:MAG: class I SAM-dependent rRNA methyltransferase, partial [Acholeplasmataceae bacterium]
YDDYLSIQILSYGIDVIKSMFIDILVDLFHPKGIYERSDASVRKKEGLELFTGTIYGEVPDTIIIKENHLNMEINIKTGQKTGTFLDQQENHKKLKDYVVDKTVLDCFSHIGGFGLHAASFGAKSVTCLDISEQAVNQIKRNAELNNIEHITALKKDVFQALRDYQEQKEQFDVIILDPPAFAKKREDTKKAYQGYKEINLQALKLIKPGGTLITCSCSHFMTPELFMEMTKDASKDANRLVQMIDFWIQGRDHPMLISSDESLYLKCIVLKVKK